MKLALPHESFATFVVLQNHLLDSLPASDYERVASHLELVPMKLGDVLYEPA